MTSNLLLGLRGVFLEILTGGIFLTVNLQGQDLSSTNLDRLMHFRSAVEASAGPVTVLAFGDSVSAPYRSIQLFLFESLQNRLGSSGYSLLPDGAWWQPGAGTWLTNQTSDWWTLHAVVPPGGSLLFTGADGASGSVNCDKLGVFWIAQPNGGIESKHRATERAHGGDRVGEKRGVARCIDQSDGVFFPR